MQFFGNQFGRVVFQFQADAVARTDASRRSHLNGETAFRRTSRYFCQQVRESVPVLEVEHGACPFHIGQRRVGGCHGEDGLVSSCPFQDDISGTYLHSHVVVRAAPVAFIIKDEFTFGKINKGVGFAVTVDTYFIKNLQYGIPVGFAVVGDGSVVGDIINSISQCPYIGWCRFSVFVSGVGEIKEYVRFVTCHEVCPCLAIGRFRFGLRFRGGYNRQRACLFRLFVGMTGRYHQ